MRQIDTKKLSTLHCPDSDISISGNEYLLERTQSGDPPFSNNNIILTDKRIFRKAVTENESKNILLVLNISEN